ncbi:MAG: hypothetical protein C0596_14710 [Marinilabiliales bacterium]|nr:MAG: hypothetical protein C0596_14710 [Marinilabiliales bacterium]
MPKETEEMSMKANLLKFIRNKKVSIPIFILILAGIIVGVYFTFFNKDIQGPKDGNAAFYEYPSDKIDAILENLKPEEKLNFLFMGSNLGNENYSNNKIDYTGGFYFSYTEDTSTNIFLKTSSSGYFINAISENILKYFSNDSILYADPELLSTISDSEFLEKYFKYQIDNLLDLHINALVIKYDPPLKSDSISFKFITEKQVIKLELLHKNNMLSFIMLDSLPEFEDQNTGELFVKSLQELADSGLCGLVFTNASDINKLENLAFDGIKGIIIDNASEISANIATDFDFYILNNYTKTDESNIKEIVKSLDKESLHIKSAKVLRAGYWANTSRDTTDSIRITFKPKVLQTKLIENSITVIKNEGNLIPLININQKLHFVYITEDKPQKFIETIDKYSSNYTFAFYNKNSEKTPYLPKNVSATIFLYDNFEGSDSIPYVLKNAIENSETESIFINYGKLPSDIAEIKSTSIVQSYTNDDIALSFTAQLIWGGISAGGKLPYYLNDTLKTGYGIFTNKTRLKYSIPEYVGLNADTLKKIDSIINYAISTGVMPGCQVFIAKNGVVVHNKSYGYHDYSRTNAVSNTDMYDIASLTKICGTTLAMMKMVEQGRIRLDDEIGEYFDDTEIDYSNIEPDTITFIDTVSIFNKTDAEIEKLVENKDTIHLNDTLVELTEIVITRLTPELNIFKVPVRALLRHESGVSPSLPILPYMFYDDTYAELLRKEIKENDSIQELLAADTIAVDTSISFTPKEAFDCFYSKVWIEDSAEIKIADGMYLRKRWQDSLYKDIKRLTVYPRRLFQYTDMNMILCAMAIDSVNDKHINEYLYEEFYKTLGLKNTSYNPLNYFPRYKIAPTESETFWRRQVINGTVHYPSAAMLGGISGNAGLFSTASDLGIIAQMWLNGCSYGGIRYLNPGTINMFTATQPESNRGLGFDKAAIRNLNAESAPPSTFGHTGFTGCVLWVDPENEIVYVFLSNRLHPNVNNWTILGQRVLQNVHQVVYDAIIE